MREHESRAARVGERGDVRARVGVAHDAARVREAEAHVVVVALGVAVLCR